MTREEATEHAQQLGRTHPDRAKHRWMPKQGPNGDWQVAKIDMPPGLVTRPLTETIEQAPRPAQPDDPRTNVERDVGGPWIGG